MLINTAESFTGYAPLGVVPAAMFGVGLADLSGCLPALLKRILSVMPGSFVVPMLAFAGNHGKYIRGCAVCYCCSFKDDDSV